jgi:tetratricopeptide (TPR) repeat protein
VIAMRADHRFDTLLATYPDHFDVDVAVERALVNTRAALDSYPRSLAAVVRHGHALLTARRAAEVVALSGRTLGTVDRSSRGIGLPVTRERNFGRDLPWLYDMRAAAFEALGQDRQALADRERAVLLATGMLNDVSFQINLAAYLIRLERPADALAVLDEHGSASAYGRLLIAHARLSAAVLLNDRAGAEAALAYLDEHREVRPSVYQSALVVARELDEAERYFIARLEDPVLRADALLSAQRFVDPASTVAEPEAVHKWREFLDRAAIRSAIDRIGRVETYALPFRTAR